MFKVPDTNRGSIVNARFSSLEVRTRFYKARTKLGPNLDIWVNDDLLRNQERLALQARILYHEGKIF